MTASSTSPPALSAARTRAQRHLLGASVVAGWLLAAAAAAVLHSRLPAPTWLALHLLLLGAATNAVFVWGLHFARVLLRTADPGEARERLRLVALNAGIVAVLVGVAGHHTPVTVAGAAVAGLAVVEFTVTVVRMQRAGPGSPLAGTVRYYVAGAAFLLAGGALGAVLAAHVVSPGRLESAIVLAHLHANLLGWLGLAILGTELQLWPTVLRRKLEDSVPATIGRVLPAAAGGLALAVGGLLLGWRWLAVAGLAGYAGAVLLALDPFVRTARRRAPRDAASTLMAAGTAWLAAAVLADVGTVAARGTGESAEAVFGRLVPMLAVGFVGQVLAGALTFLLPVVLGGGPAGNRRLTGVLSVGWPFRLAATNVGVALVALPLPNAWHVAGWVLALLGLATFAPLAVTSVRAEAAGPPTRRRAAVALALVPAAVIILVAALR